LNRSPKILLGACTLSTDGEIFAVLNFGTYAANDFARECSTLPFRPKAAAAGWALDSVDRNLAPNAGRPGGVAVLEGVVI
jgi:hypothetical protein